MFPHLSVYRLDAIAKYIVISSLCIATTVYGKQADLNESSEYVFDSAMFRGSHINQDKLHRLAKSSILAGRYDVDVYINQQFIEKAEVLFVDINNDVDACLTPTQIERWNILAQNSLRPSQSDCQPLSQWLDAGTLSFDQSKLRLNLSIPQTLLKQVPRGYVAPEFWDAGESVAYVNYLANYYHNDLRGHTSFNNSDSVYISLNGGFNIGQWQFRQQSNMSIQDDHRDFNLIRSYLKRPLPQIAGELSLGQLNTSGLFFSGLPYKGFHLNSDERMLPDSQRGYAPVVQGVANTLARVSILQNGREIYQTTVSPGPFRITDLYPTSYNGDLDVIIYEADGRRSSFKVPFSAVPESVRPGHLKYNIDVGKTDNVGEDSLFGSFTGQYGLNNALTLNSGLQVADDYQAFVFGTAWTNRLGAMGADVTFANASLAQNRKQGYMLGLSYSKTLATTNTTFALASYRFSSNGYRDLASVLQQRTNESLGLNAIHENISQRSRFTASVNQHFGKYGTLSLSGSAQDYYNSDQDEYQLQVGYGKTFNSGTTVNFNIARQSYVRQTQFIDHTNDSFTDTTYGLSVSLPLGKNKLRAPDLSMNYQHAANGDYYQVNVSGQIDQAKTMHYNVGIQHAEQEDQTSLNANLQKRFSNVSTNISAAINKQSWQVSANAQGAIALHDGGITFGPYLGDTFAIIEAKGAEGASVSNYQGAKINKHGYALVPSLNPYRYNRIVLNSEGMDRDTEITQGEQRVVPFAGAGVKVKFETRQGQALLIRALTSNQDRLPLGADVLDDAGQTIGVVGQNSQIYLRAKRHAGQLKVIWGNSADEQCSIPYDLTDAEKDEHLTRINAICHTGE